MDNLRVFGFISHVAGIAIYLRTSNLWNSDFDPTPKENEKKINTKTPFLSTMKVGLGFNLPQTAGDSWVYARVYAFSPHFVAPGVHSSDKSYAVILGQPITGLISASEGKYGTCISRPANSPKEQPPFPP